MFSFKLSYSVLKGDQVVLNNLHRAQSALLANKNFLKKEIWDHLVDLVTLQDVSNSRGLQGCGWTVFIYLQK